jgi:hypothetical protein
MVEVMHVLELLESRVEFVWASGHESGRSSWSRADKATLFALYSFNCLSFLNVIKIYHCGLCILR